MHFLGISSTNPLSEEGPIITNYEKEYKNGDICIYNNIDYIYDGSNWQKLGNDGKSAYELAVEAGFTGTETEWLESLTGPIGPQGESAYEIAKEKGFVGSEEDWLESLKGADGQQGVAGQDGKDWAPTEQELNDIADRAISRLPDADNQSY